MLYVLCDQWVRERQALVVQGVDEPGFDETVDTVYTGRSGSRLGQVITAGGEVG